MSETLWSTFRKRSWIRLLAGGFLGLLFGFVASWVLGIYGFALIPFVFILFVCGNMPGDTTTKRRS